MTRLYRILRKAYGHAPFDGEGAYRYGGRWSSSGTRLSYTSEHQSLAMLEYFVHLDPGEPPEDAWERNAAEASRREQHARNEVAERLAELYQAGFHADARAVRDELWRRLDVDGNAPHSPTCIDNGLLLGPDPLGTAATLLEDLATQLP